MEISASMVKELRERTGAGMMDCKKALNEAGGDMEKAIDILREKGLAAASKKASRIAAEGLVTAYISDDRKCGSLVEVNCETDFVAKNNDFINFVNELAKIVAEQNPAVVTDDANSGAKALVDLKMSSGKTVKETLTELIANIGENMNIRRFVRLSVSGEGAVESYIHMGGKIGVLVQLSCNQAQTAKNQEFLALARDLGMQVAAARPDYIRRTEVPADVLEREKAIYKAQAMEEGKPEAIAEKIVVGRLEKYYKEVCLVEQIFIKDNDKTVTKLLGEIGQKLGDTLDVAAFARFEKGEGLEKRQDDFASEVMSQIQQ
ncbi:MAG TPA: translation elongation factor Ts [Bacillota bacterium]|nr:translation elongation factor Ts [Bacillota bacterium]HPT67945.1 translation elongation factor Ts [Bacillota bacterium]